MKLNVKAVLVTSLCAAMLPLSIWSAPIQEVDVTVYGKDLPEPLQKRMQASVTTVSNHLFVGKDTLEVESRQGEYEQVAHDIISRVLYGYTLEEIQLQVKERSHLHLVVKPFGDVIEHVEMTIDYGNLSEVGKELVNEDLKHVQLHVDQMLLGAPVEALDWMIPVTQMLLREELQGVLPEFTPQVVITGEEQAKVQIYLVPQGEIIRQTVTEIESRTLPTALFYSLKMGYDKKIKHLIGLPAAFVNRHESSIIDTVKADLANSSAVKRFGIDLEPSLYAGASTKLVIGASSDKYVVRGEGYLDMGRKDDSVGFKLHTGYLVHPRHELYVETEFLPESYEWNFYPSYSYRWTPETLLGYQYRLDDGEHRLWLRQSVGDRWHLRAQREFKAQKNEFALSYDIHSYMTLEYIFNSDDNWLRVIGHI